MKSSTAIVSLLSAVPLASAWGNLGHQTIAYVAQDFLNSDTESWAQDILGDSSTSYLANYATWADTFKYTSAGTFSKPYHFIDANDNPPSSCSVDFDRDCDAEGCVVGAIANYTNIVSSESSSSDDQNQALMFLIHFLGDIHQPLHDEALEVGGNDIDVKYSGSSTNLHHIWDTNMPEQYAGGYSLSDARAWATELTKSIRSGAYSNQAEGWLDGTDISDPQESAMTWASDANSYVCSSVFSESQSQIEKDTDLAGDYYDQALPVIKLQFAKGGYRLGAWLNLIATGSTS